MITGRFFRSMLTAAMIVAICAPMLQAQEEDTVLAGHKSRIKELIEAGEWSEAVEAAERALADYPKDGNLLFLKITAVAEQNKIKTENTIKSLERSISLGIDSHAVHRNLAREYMKNGKNDKAIEHYSAAQPGYMDDAKFHLEFAYCYYMFVPNDAQYFKGKLMGLVYKQALDTAEKLLIHAKTLAGAEKLNLSALLKNIEFKRERLNKGRQYKPNPGPFIIDPKTARIIEKKAEEDKK